MSDDAIVVIADVETIEIEALGDPEPIVAEFMNMNGVAGPAGAQGPQGPQGPAGTIDTSIVDGGNF